MKVQKSIGIDYGHSLPNHFSFCNQLHGHRGTVTIEVSGPLVVQAGSSSEGMVIDFKILKQLLQTHVYDKLDHGFAVWEKDPDREFIQKRNTRVLVTSEPPTAECLARWAYKQLIEHLPDGLVLESVAWQETPSSQAIFLKSDI